MDAEKYEKGVTGVFWDSEECKIPSGLNALLVSKNIRSALKNASFRGVTSIFAYGSTENIMVGFDTSAGKVVNRTTAASSYRGAACIYENESLGDDLKVLDKNESPEIVMKRKPGQLRRSASGSLFLGSRDNDTLHLPLVESESHEIVMNPDMVSRDEVPAIVMYPTKSGDKHERYGAFIRGVFSWALDNDPPANMILILGDVAEHKYRFIAAFNHLRDAGYNVAFVQPQKQASMYLMRLGNRNWPWERLSLGEGSILIPRPEPNSSVGSPNFRLPGIGGALACFLIVILTYGGAKMVATR